MQPVRFELHMAKKKKKKKFSSLPAVVDNPHLKSKENLNKKASARLSHWNSTHDIPEEEE